MLTAAIAVSVREQIWTRAEGKPMCNSSSKSLSMASLGRRAPFAASYLASHSEPLGDAIGHTTQWRCAPWGQTFASLSVDAFMVGLQFVFSCISFTFLLLLYSQLFLWLLFLA